VIRRSAWQSREQIRAQPIAWFNAPFETGCHATLPLGSTLGFALVSPHGRTLGSKLDPPLALTLGTVLGEDLGEATLPITDI
jgi:hypothetical protein